MSQNESLDERQARYRQAAIAQAQADYGLDIAEATEEVDALHPYAAANLNAANADEDDDRIFIESGIDPHTGANMTDAEMTAAENARVNAIIDATVEEARLAHLEAQLSPHHYQYVPVGTICIRPECNTQIHSSQYHMYCEPCYAWNRNIIESESDSDSDDEPDEPDEAGQIEGLLQALNNGTAEVTIINRPMAGATPPTAQVRQPATDIPPLELGEIIVTDQIPSDDVSSVSSEITLEDSMCCCCMESCDTQTTCNHSICLVCANSVSTTRVWRTNDEGRSVFYQNRHISDHIRPCPCCRANITELIRRPLSDAQRLGRYDELVAQNTRLDSEALLQATVINALRSEIAQHNSNSQRPAVINPSNGEAIVAPPATQRREVVRRQVGAAGGGERRREPIVVQVAVGDQYAGRPSGIATVVNLTPTQVLGDLDFNARPRRRCVGTWYYRELYDNAPHREAVCRRYTRRVCPSCRNRHICSQCEVCDGCEIIRRQRSESERNRGQPPLP